MLPQKWVVSIFVDSIFKESFFGSANEGFCFISPEFEIFPVLLLMIKVSIFLSKGNLFSKPCGFLGMLVENIGKAFNSTTP